ncbi:Flp family type IVb pilin [Thioclava sp. F28-4]|uniref:Flp family type IVb pilin n=1 Tax=Thioclava sp. F28-4 TaxID=1915315 RepID=UPI00099869E9|nr:hypothetical protein [Thioclava sp. F28-4]OOY06278.1 hypothetical protein BMI87_01875 [Thioclava sp. F28-4]
MKLFKLASLRRLKSDEEGVTVVEYGIALAVAVGIGSAIYTTLGTAVHGEMLSGAQIMDSTATGAYGN